METWGDARIAGTHFAETPRPILFLRPGKLCVMNKFPSGPGAGCVGERDAARNSIGVTGLSLFPVRQVPALERLWSATQIKSLIHLLIRCCSVKIIVRGEKKLNKTKTTSTAQRNGLWIWSIIGDRDRWL